MTFLKFKPFTCHIYESKLPVYNMHDIKTNKVMKKEEDILNTYLG